MQRPWTAIFATFIFLALNAKIKSMSTSPVSIDPEVMSGAAVFSGTRVPVRTFIDYLEGGESVEEFLEGFPSVTREQVIAFLELMSEKVVELAR